MDKHLLDVKRHFLLLMLCCLAAIASGCASPPLRSSTVFAPPASTSLVVRAETLNMRQCPDTTCPVIALLYKGETVVVRRSSGDWSEIERKEGGIGWVASRYLGDHQGLTGGSVASPAPVLPEEELAKPQTIAPPEISDELAEPGATANPQAPPAISEEFGQ